ncbi:hypothetical protein [Brevibacillus sp. SIMBA_076]|uniref:hypothetical protein n=1 Tax=Brevibacillus sp. SIMBA_076 TaxID=3085814 RepID=UPI00397A29B7
MEEVLHTKDSELTERISAFSEQHSTCIDEVNTNTHKKTASLPYVLGVVGPLRDGTPEVTYICMKSRGKTEPEQRKSGSKRQTKFSVKSRERRGLSFDLKKAEENQERFLKFARLLGKHIKL